MTNLQLIYNNYSYIDRCLKIQYTKKGMSIYTQKQQNGPKFIIA